MIILIFLFVLGILVGWLLRNRKKIEALSGRLTQWSIAILLFLLGVGVGGNEEIRGHLDSLGITALLIAIFSVGGSIFISWITWRLFYKRR